MPIAVRTRKILWALSGNRCALCTQQLIEEPTPMDPEAVVGQECHIISPKGKGPRYDIDFPQSEIDCAANLILLCPTHHAIVDAQDSTYTADRLRAAKREHEASMRDARRSTNFIPQIRFVRTKDAIPKTLKRLTTGRELLGILESLHAMYFNHPPVLTREDADLFGRFGQDLEDWGMLVSDGESRLRVDAELALNELLEELSDSGFAVFGAMEKQRVEGGVQEPGDWLVAHITVARIDDPSIVWCHAPDRHTKDGQAPTSA
jgi:hypothetical protein